MNSLRLITPFHAILTMMISVCFLTMGFISYMDNFVTKQELIVSNMQQRIVLLEMVTNMYEHKISAGTPLTEFEKYRLQEFNAEMNVYRKEMNEIAP